MTTKTNVSSKGRCRLCGDETKVSKGIWRLKSGKFVDILRCVDHAACEERRAAT